MSVPVFWAYQMYAHDIVPFHRPAPIHILSIVYLFWHFSWRCTRNRKRKCRFVNCVGQDLYSLR